MKNKIFQKSTFKRSLLFMGFVALFGTHLAGCTQTVPRQVGTQPPVSKEDRFPIVVKGGKAYTQKCGYWPKDLSSDFYNSSYPNFGCSTQNNLAAMLDKPSDSQKMRASYPSNGARRAVAIDKYNTGTSSESSSTGTSSSSSGTAAGSTQ